MTQPIAALLGLWIAFLSPAGTRSADGAQPDADWLRRAREQAVAVEDPLARAKLFGRIAVASAQLGDEAGYRRDIARAREAMATAPKTLAISPVDSAEVDAVPPLIAARLKAGDFRRAKDLAEEHLKGHEFYRSIWIAPIAVAEAKAGDFDAALATINLAGESGRDDVLTGVAAALVLRGDPRAERVIGMIGDDGPLGRSGALGAIALALAGAGRHAEAFATLEKANDERVRIGYRVEVAEIQARAGAAEAARATVASLPSEQGRDLAYTQVALVEIDRAEIAGAKLTATKIVGVTRRAQLLRAIAEAEARTGRLDDCRRTADSIPVGERERRETFQILVAALARSGDLDGAVRVADDQSEVEWQADIAFIALDLGRNAEARRIVDRLRQHLALQPEASGSLGPRLALLEARLGDPTALDVLVGDLEILLRTEPAADRRQPIEARLFGLYLNSGRMDGVRRIVLGKSTQEIEIMIAWAVGLAVASGDLGRAEDLTFLLSTPGPRESYVALLAVAHLKKGGVNAAVAWVDHLPTPHDHAAAYLGLADPHLSR